MKNLLLYILLLLQVIDLSAQDLVPQKNDHSTLYFDSLLQPCKVNTASYFGYVPKQNYYFNNTPLQEKTLKYKLIYTPFSDTIIESALKPLHGEVIVFPHQHGVKKFDHFYVFSMGTLTQMKEPSKKGTHVQTYYLDSLKNGDQSTFTRYTSEKEIPIYKEYLNKNGNKSLPEKIFLGEHKHFTSKLKPVLGLYWNLGPEEEMKRNSRTFFELGITKKYLKGTYAKSVKKNYYDNISSYHSVNATFLGTSRGNQIYFGQKATYCYTYLFFKAEAGILNYTDLKKDDVRLVGGLGFSVMSALNGMAYYSLPLTKNEFKDLGRIAIGLSFSLI